MVIRRATHTDVSEAIVLFKQTVLYATTNDYNEAQRQAWARKGANLTRWENRINTQYFLVAEQTGHLVGFGSITTEGYLDVLYVHHNYQGKGVATGLLTQLETWVTQRKLECITTDASITARPFFERHGYQTVNKQENVLEGQVLVNFRMEKRV